MYGAASSVSPAGRGRKPSSKATRLAQIRLRDCCLTLFCGHDGVLEDNSAAGRNRAQRRVRRGDKQVQRCHEGRKSWVLK